MPLLFKNPNPATAGAVQFSDGTQIMYGSGGLLTVPDRFGQEAVMMGLARVDVVPTFTTAQRPTANLWPGMQIFDSTLGKPVWRNAANNGWVDATGTAA